MGIMQKAYETYDNHLSFVGKYSSNEKVFREPLAPIGHITTTAQIEITIDTKGRFISAIRVDTKEPKIVIPVTEESAGRTSGICPHPLCDNIGYIAPDNKIKNDAYTKQLTDWSESDFSHPLVDAVLIYVKGETIINDLKKSGISSLDEKDTVRWVVVGLEEKENPQCWANEELFNSFYRYYKQKKEEKDKVVCMITGEETVCAEQHIKGIISINGNAKLISANDKTNFTYRGRFISENETVTVGYEASQKAHNALKWIAADQGVVFGGRTFVCWNPQGKVLHRPLLPLRNNESPVRTISEYKNDIKDIINSYKRKFNPEDNAVIASFDAATTGRLAVSYYSELPIDDFFERMKYWDETCCWTHHKKGIISPSLQQIVLCSFGTERNGKIDVDEKVMKQQIQRLLSCRIDKAIIPYDFVQALAQKTKQPLAYDKQREYVIFTACAVIRKYYLDSQKGDFKMALEKEKKDISYQYGRLLAVLEKAERDTYDQTEGREPNAIRLQSIFCVRPGQTTKTLVEQVKTGYYPKLNPGARIMYDKLIGEIMTIISDFPEEDWNKAVKETYIMGYYLQKNELYTKHSSKNETEEN